VAVCVVVRFVITLWIMNIGWPLSDFLHLILVYIIFNDSKTKAHSSTFRALWCWCRMPSQEVTITVSFIGSFGA